MQTYKGLKGETTEWEDVQYKFGNKVGKYATEAGEREVLEAKLEAIAQDHFVELPDPLSLKTTEELEHHLEDHDEDAAALAEIRNRRLQALKQTVATGLFGSLKHITREEYIDEVTNAGQGVCVVLLLLEDGHEGCSKMVSILKQLAQHFPRTKFRSIRSTDAIPNFPSKELPCILFYKNSALVSQATGPAVWGAAPTLDTVELELAQRRFITGSRFSDEEEDDDENADEDDRQKKDSRSQTSGVNIARKGAKSTFSFT